MIGQPARTRCFDSTEHASRQRQRILPPKTQRARIKARAQDMDVQVFRFTLGIPGFDDANIPRVVGVIGGAMLAVNHMMSASPVPDAQVRGEAIGTCLVLLLIALPSIEKELKQLGSSQGRKAAAQEVSGAKSLFLYNNSSESAARDLAWVSFASVRNSNTSSILVVWKGKVQLARGAFASDVSDMDDKIAALEQFQLSLDGAFQQPSFLQGLPAGGQYMPSKQSMRDRNLTKLSCVADGIQSALLLPLTDNNDVSFMLILSEFERALGPKDQAWLRSLSQKVRDTCQAKV